MENNKFQSKQFQNRIEEKCKIETHNTQIHDRSFSLLDTGTSIKSGGGKPILWTQHTSLKLFLLIKFCQYFSKNRFIFIGCPKISAAKKCCYYSKIYYTIQNQGEF
jgi:hypothetical protein